MKAAVVRSFATTACAAKSGVTPTFRLFVTGVATRLVATSGETF